MVQAAQFKVSTSGQMSLPAEVRRRWRLQGGGFVDVVDLGFAVLALPQGGAGRLLDEVLPADAHYDAVAHESDPDLATA